MLTTKEILKQSKKEIKESRMLIKQTRKVGTDLIAIKAKSRELIVESEAILQEAARRTRLK